MAPAPLSPQVPRALQAFQTAKKELPSLQLDKVTFGTLINGLTRPYGANNNVASARRALQLWAEMRLLGLAPDARIVTPLFDACTRHVGVETVLKLRVELVRMGWNVAALRPHDQVLIAALPSLKEVLRDQPKWEALGVRLPPTLLESPPLYIQRNVLISPYHIARISVFEYLICGEMLVCS